MKLHLKEMLIATEATATLTGKIFLRWQEMNYIRNKG